MTIREMFYNDIKGHKFKKTKKKRKPDIIINGDKGISYKEMKAPNFAQRDRQEDNSIM